MTKTNYKLIAKKHLANLEKEYEELKIKNGEEYESDHHICTISDLEHLLESNGNYTVKRTYEDSSIVHFIDRNNFQDLNDFDYEIEKDFDKDLSKEWADIKANFIKETQNFEIAPNLYNCFNALTFQQTHCEQRVKDDIKGARVRMESLLNGKCGSRIDLAKKECLALTR